GDVVDPDAARARCMAARHPALPAALRSAVLGGGVPFGDVQRGHAANGDGARSAVSGSAAVGDVRGGVGRLDARLRGIAVGVVQDHHAARTLTALQCARANSRRLGGSTPIAAADKAETAAFPPKSQAAPLAFAAYRP